MIGFPIMNLGFTDPEDLAQLAGLQGGAVPTSTPASTSANTDPSGFRGWLKRNQMPLEKLSGLLQNGVSRSEPVPRAEAPQAPPINRPNTSVFDRFAQLMGAVPWMRAGLARFPLP